MKRWILDWEKEKEVRLINWERKKEEIILRKEMEMI